MRKNKALLEKVKSIYVDIYRKREYDFFEISIRRIMRGIYRRCIQVILKE